MSAAGWLVPAVIAGILLYALLRGVKVFDVFVRGAREGLSASIKILPAMVALMTAVGMMHVSGALDLLTTALAPVARGLGLPPELLPLALLRPVSGSGAMVIFKDVLTRFGPDGTVGRIASVLMGSTETTFYTVAVYFGAVGVTRTRHALPAALCADLLGVVMSVLAVRWLLGV